MKMAIFGRAKQKTALSETELHEVAVGVRNQLSRRGWTNGDAEDDRGVCPLRAWQYTFDLSSPVGNPPAEQFVKGMGFESTNDFMIWNDAHERRVEEVFAALDDLIRRTAPLPSDPLSLRAAYVLLDDLLRRTDPSSIEEASEAPSQESAELVLAST
jgi:hypothetical protein